MVKIPKETNRYCPKCRKQTKQKVSQVKSGKKRGTLTQGTRRFEKKKKGYTGFPRPKPEKSKTGGVKLTKKVVLMYTCKECKKSTQRKQGFRAKKVEWEAAK